ncbi:thiol reductant ABC exporter subunit CydD [Aquisalimonas sp.]|uniref:thiol reductant ABC exporter subunit CydD n=1 Tax=Aquisalimonas sp. TaxID=1872621 RepID=UPI0025BAB5DC|nr:thiol reductant ABC exporter subunit CydD [Aquisalimonas sp.]
MADTATGGPTQRRAESQADRAWLSARARAVGTPRLVCISAGILAGLLVIPQAALLAWLVHRVVVSGSGLGDVTALMALALGVFVARAVCTGVQEWAAAESANRIHQDTRAGLMRHLVALGPSGLARHAAGGLAAATVDMVNTLGPYVARYQPQLIITATVPLAIVVAVFTMDWLAGALLLLAAPLIPAFMAIVGMGAEAVSRSQHQALARLGGHFLDRLQGLDLLRHLGRAQDEARALAAVGDAYRRRTMAVLRVAFLSSAVLEFFSSVAIAMVAVYIGMGLLGYLDFGPAPELSLFSGLFILLLAPEFFQPLRQLAQHYHDRAAALGAAAELRVLTETPSPMPAGGTAHPPENPPTISLNAVTVMGDNRARLLNGISLDIEPGQALVITGPSGSGKTTLLHTIAGFHGVQGGEVRVNTAALSTLDLSAWQQRLSWLAQTPYLFPGTLRENLLLGPGDTASGHVERALGRAGLSGVLERLPAGLDTPVGEHGGGLSGGEGQRLALARALVRRAPVLLVDEPTASLDPDTAALISRALEEEAARGATVLIATHSPTLYAWAPRLLTLDQGRIRGAEHA